MLHLEWNAKMLEEQHSLLLDLTDTLVLTRVDKQCGLLLDTTNISSPATLILIHNFYHIRHILQILEDCLPATDEASLYSGEKITDYRKSSK